MLISEELVLERISMLSECFLQYCLDVFYNINSYSAIVINFCRSCMSYDTRFCVARKHAFNIHDVFPILKGKQL